METTSADLRTRMGTAETDIDTLQASDSQQTSKISALEADMNNVKPRVGQLESDVGTLETKVDQHTQSISGLSTDVNGLKTSKQDKLIAGEGIVIADDGKTISTTTAGGLKVYAGPITDLVTFSDDKIFEVKRNFVFELWYNYKVSHILFYKTKVTNATSGATYYGPSPEGGICYLSFSKFAGSDLNILLVVDRAGLYQEKLSSIPQIKSDVISYSDIVSYKLLVK